MSSRGRGERLVTKRGSSTFLGWLIAAMVYIAVLASAGALYAQSVSARWSDALDGVVTVQVPDPAAAATTEEGTTRLAAVLAVLRVTPGIRDVDLIKQDGSRALLEPWLGKDLTDGLDLPALIDVHFLAAGAGDLASLRLRLEQAAPGTTASDHGEWISRVAGLAAAMTRGGWLIVALVGLVSLLSVVFAVMSGVWVNRDIIELLHLMGAEDGYVASRFQGHVLAAALPASIIGALCAGATVLAVLSLTGFPDGVEWSLDLGAGAWVGLAGWAVLAAVPVAFVVMTMITARLAALVALRRMT